MPLMFWLDVWLFLLAVFVDFLVKRSAHKPEHRDFV